MIKLGALFALAVAAGAIYEAVGIQFFPAWTITELTKRKTHLMIILLVGLSALLGYLLGGAHG